MKTIRFLTILSAIAMMFNSCSKQGATGPAGANGANGTNGANGVANITSNDYVVATNDWNTIQGGYATGALIDGYLSNATTDGVEGFISIDNTIWYPMPFSNFLTIGDEILYDYGVNKVTLIYATSGPSPSSTLYFKTVIIPPAALNVHPHTNWKDWNEVSAVMQSEKATK